MNAEAATSPVKEAVRAGGDALNWSGSMPRPAARKQRAADQIVDILVQHGVRTIFGLPGGALFPLYDALADHPEVCVVTSKHETMAVFAAAAYARLTEEVGVVLVTSGPGVTNALTGLASAFCDSIPVLVLAGEVPRSQFGRGALQEGSRYSLDVLTMVKSITKAAYELTNARLTGAVLNKALATARSGRKGPVLVSLPLDVSGERVDSPKLKTCVTAQFAVDGHLIDEVADLLAGAERPLIIAGSGARWGAGPHQLRRLAERGRIPVATSPKAKGVFPENHPLALGVYGYGGHPSAQKYLDGGVDVLFAIGTGLGEISTNTWNVDIRASTAFVQLDIDAAQIGRNYRADIGLVGPAETILGNVLDRLPQRTSPSLVRGIERLSDPALLPACPKPLLSPARAVWELENALPDDTIFSVDSGEHTLFALHYLTLDRPDRFYFSGGLGSMGSGIGGAIGIKMGLPERPVACICGDGGLAMNGTEILTAVQQKLPIIFAVFDDGRYGMVENGLKHVFSRTQSFSMRPMSVCGLARSLGAEAIAVHQPGELLAIDFERVLSGEQPLVLDIIIDPAERLQIQGRLNALKAGALGASA